MDSLLQDTKFAIRTLFKDRGFVTTAVLALALGIGSVTAIFSVIDNVLLNPFPYRGGNRLVGIEIHDSSRPDQQGGRQGYLQAEFIAYQQQNHVFDDSIGLIQDRVLMTDPSGRLESFLRAKVTGNAFEFCGMPPLLGRYTTPADAKPDAPPVFVLSYKLWQSRFSGDPNIIGKTYILNGTPTTLVGIMPKRFTLWGAELWMPFTPNAAETDINSDFAFLLGRLRPGITPHDAIPDLTVIARRLAKLYPVLYPKQFDVRVPLLIDNVVGRFRETLYILLGAVGLLLLIACANVANLLLARATAREKEFAVRSSLGAGAWRLIRQLLVESTILAWCGAALGCAFAAAGLRGLMAALPKFTFPDEADVRLNLPVLAATVALTMLTPLIFGLVPAFGAFSRNMAEPLKAGGRGNSGFRRGRMRNMLVVLEVAMSLFLLSGAGLLMRSFLLQKGADLGFRADQLVTTQVNLGKKYNTTEMQYRFAHDLVEKLRTYPGVRAASAALEFPPFGGIPTTFNVAGVTHSEKWSGQLGLIDAYYLQTVGSRLLSGRSLTDADMQGKHMVALVNQTFVTKLLGGRNPVGKQVRIDVFEQAPVPIKNPWFEIIGVTSDLRNHGAVDPIQPEAYTALTMSGYGGFGVFVKTMGNPAPMKKDLESAVLALDKSVVPQQTDTLQNQLDLFVYSQARFGLELFAVFASVGFILVCVGVYSVVSYTVSQQKKEFGIRMALGARLQDVTRLVIWSGMRFILLGIAIGVAISFALLRVMKNQIAGITTYDPLTLTGVIVVLALAGIVACYVPSRRATRVDPLISLRYE
ncbi:MAG: ABC transporter permease [Acidobacteriaceae bacterium]|nr:ABC transporter permease [Acidobacteriaceae bacterium]MBV9763477.1 ABC transporter permease [Acidobacteriaceae bacterium]